MGWVVADFLKLITTIVNARYRFLFVQHLITKLTGRSSG